MTARTAAIVVAAIDGVAFAVVAVALFASGSDPATRGLDVTAGGVLVGLFAVTALPALVLLYLRRAARTALVLALAFPAAFLLLFSAVMIAFM